MLLQPVHTIVCSPSCSEVMLLGAAVWLVVLATSGVSAQATQNYDLADCRIYKMVGNHAENPNDCRTYYNCDNFFGGKLATCAEGTTYNRNSGVCDTATCCENWKTAANCVNNPTAMMNFKGQCCHTYYEFSCASCRYTLKYCASGQHFDVNSRRCIAASASSCVDKCGDIARGCEGTHLKPVPGDPCRFQKDGTNEVMQCPEGTSFDPTICICNHDTNRNCTKIKVGCDKWTFTGRIFQLNAQATSPPSLPVTLWKLSGTDYFYPIFSLLIAFTVNANDPAGTTYNLFNSATCNGTQLSAQFINRQQYRVTLANGVDTVSATLNANNQFQNNKKLLIVISSSELMVYDSRTNVQSSGNPSVVTKLANRMPRAACELTVGPFSGTVTEVSYWKGCTSTNTQVFPV